MDRFEWSNGVLGSTEKLVVQYTGVQLYDGEEKTVFSSGRLQLTTHRLIWQDPKDERCILALPLSCVMFTEQLAASFNRSAKVIVHLNPAPTTRKHGPVPTSHNSYIRLSFKDAKYTPSVEPQARRRSDNPMWYLRDFHTQLKETVAKKVWLSANMSAVGAKPARSGIAGIEKRLEQKHRETDKHISVAFEDLGKLMEKAREMVTLSRKISDKIREKQGDITEDETIRFQSYLLSLGISDPVTRDSHGSGSQYFTHLARQINTMLEGTVKDCGGMMTLTDVYCRVNRARGMELLSPEDLITACKQMDSLKLSLRLHLFESGVLVLQLQSHSEQEMAKQTTALVTEVGSMTADELSRRVGVSVVLSKERLLSSEKIGKLCRDETIEGLRFYPNLFLTKT